MSYSRIEPGTYEGKATLGDGRSVVASATVKGTDFCEVRIGDQVWIGTVAQEHLWLLDRQTNRMVRHEMQGALWKGEGDGGYVQYLVVAVSDKVSVLLLTPATDATLALVWHVVFEQKKPESVVQLMQVDLLSVEVGKDLLHLVDPSEGARLMERVTAIRRHLALELGIVVPGVRFRHNLQLPGTMYSIRVRDFVVGQGNIETDKCLAVTPHPILPLEGRATLDPTYGMPAVWIAESDRKRAEAMGAMVFDPVSVIATHLTEVVRQNAPMLLGRQEVQAMVDGLAKTHPVLWPGLSDRLSVASIQRILQNLVRERVNIRDLPAILEALDEPGPDTQSLTERARLAVGRTLCREYANDQGYIRGIGIDGEVQDELKRRWDELKDVLLAALRRATDEMRDKGLQPILVVGPALRPKIRALAQADLPNLAVLSTLEVSLAHKFEALVTIRSLHLPP
jgi:flagellar biosynthesis protein FlhA